MMYARGNSIKTRQWIWRQGVSGMITADTTDIFYPIDGFSGINDTAVLNARDELAEVLANTLGCRTSFGWVDKKSMEFAIE